jgi:hypothetical protein
MPGGATRRPPIRCRVSTATLASLVAIPRAPIPYRPPCPFRPPPSPSSAPVSPLPGQLADALDALEADTELAGVLGDYFVGSFLAYKRNEIERFERFVTDWEFREYAYHR